MAQDENRGLLTRFGASFMAAAEGLNVFRPTSSIRRGGRQLDEGLADGRERLKKTAPAGVREVGQVVLGVGKSGSLGMNAGGLVGLGETIRDQGAVETGKGMVTGLVEGIKNDPLDLETLNHSRTAIRVPIVVKTNRWPSCYLVSCLLPCLRWRYPFGSSPFRSSLQTSQGNATTAHDPMSRKTVRAIRASFSYATHHEPGQAGEPSRTMYY